MSQEFRLLAECPHLTIEEHVQLDTDRRTLLTSQPIASGGLVRITANDEVGEDFEIPLLIPQGGLFVSAEIKGGVSSPFNILQNENVLTVRTNTEAVTVQLPLGPRVSADQVVKRIRAEASTFDADSDRGFLVFTDRARLGADSRVYVEGSAASAVGFAGQSGARGNQLYPGWVLLTKTGTLYDRIPQFFSPVKANPVFKATYSVPRERCLRCGAFPVENDYRFDPTGQAILIENENLLYQAALKIILTNKGSNPFHTWYGTKLQSRIGTKAIATTSALLSEDVRRSLSDLQTLQREQAKYQEVTFKERLYLIESVRAFPHPEDPTTFFIDVVVRNASNEPVALSIVFTVPGVIGRIGGGGTSRFFGVPL